MKKMTLLLLSSLFISIISYSQTILSGQLKDKQGNVLPYANIGIKNGKIGTISSIEGNFSIVLADSLLKDSLTFSSIGFQEKTLAISQLKDRKALVVVLNEKIIPLSEVKITNVKRKQHKLGITGRTPMIFIPSKSYHQHDIIEQARLIRLKKPAQILNANIFILSETGKQAQIRINFYALENGLPGKRLVEKTIIKQTTVQKGWLSVDLHSEGIYLDQDFVIAFEYLPSEQRSIAFGAKVGAADSFLRNSSLGIWRKNAVGGCSIYVTAEM